MIPEPRIHSGHVEISVAELVGWRANVVVPNVSWGLGLRHECDLLILDKQGRFTEVEIKVSLADLKADFKKGHGHKSKLISRLVYAVPQSLLESAKELVPKGQGIIAVKWNTRRGRHEAHWERVAKHDKTKPKPSEAVVKKFMALGCMRIWSLKKTVMNIKRRQS